ncbi:hypothetical protein NUW58_g9111 [Xylaria curta]|uniref:Uncharacterized protein n=1 Tax=Xylaria curta TaxID=42375 RepID=A0ACC1N128_9PEZI|nr:hypothetical protein NUW58_g9111 [Xylaria curta]
MKGSKPVCLLCRLQVAKAAIKTRSAQWQTQTARLSTTSSRLDAHSIGRAAPDDATIPESAGNPSQSPVYVRRIVTEQHRHKPSSRFSQTKVAQGQPSSSRVDALFQQIVQEQQDLENTDGDAPAPEGASIDLSLVKAIGRLQEMVDKNAPVAEAYRYFQTEINPAIQVPGTHVPQAYHRVKFAMLEKLVAAKKADMFADDLPAVADIFRVYAEAGELKPKEWTALVGELVHCIINIDPSADTQSPLRYGSQLALRESMVADLVESWKLLSLPRLAISLNDENALTNGFWFPRLDKFSLSKFAKKGNFPAAFSTLFPQYPRSQLDTPVAVLAIITYALLHDRKRCSVGVRQNATRFMSKVAYLITFVNYRDEALQRDLVRTFPGLEEYVMGFWPTLKAYLKQNRESENEKSTEIHRISPSPSNKQAVWVLDAASIARRLNQPYSIRNVGEVDRLWEKFVGSEGTISEERAAHIRHNPHLVDSFIRIHIMLNQPDKAIAVWNLLGKVGLKPSLRTWNLMLGGLRKAGNLHGIKNVWAKLAKSGLKLDTGIWTTRIVGLIDCGDVEGGLHALEEMASMWENDPNEFAVKPTIEPVNAALGGLIRRKQNAAAERLLAWASRKGIEPDIFTFNTMLRSLIRDENRSKDVNNLLAAMCAQGVRADEATFTIILDATFSKREPRDPEEQASIVADIASAMASAGLDLNMQTYGKMIYTLLCSNATAAAMAVVNHLNRRTWTRCDLFVHRRRHLDFDDMDHVFYERVIGGFTRAGKASAALDAYNHVVEAGASMSLPVLDNLLLALLREQRLKEARVMVNREKKRFEAQYPNPEEHTRYWNHQFWQLASRYNLLDSPLPSRKV